MFQGLRLAAVAFGIGLGLAAAGPGLGETAHGEGAVPPAAPAAVANTSTADHSTFEILKKDFASGPEVTEACLTCHTEADDQVMHSIHFQWSYESNSGQTLGKSNVINAFCGAVTSNEPRCTSCHAGYGWTDMTQTPQEQNVTVDCLACHDRSGQYTKTATGAGHPPLDPVKPGTQTITGAEAWPVDLTKAAQSVGMPGRDNCGNCHFYGGGGDNVKHGDLSSALFNPPLAVDVHMSPEGANMTCSTCHVEEQHQWAGSRYDVVAADHPDIAPGGKRVTASCESCHSETPHDPLSPVGMKLNDHTDVLACQSCHIPEFARGGAPTKTMWDWSTAGRLDADGKPITESDWISPTTGQHFHTYMSQKGDFDWGEDVVPTYAWFNGEVEYTLPEQTLDPTQVVPVNKIHGSPEDGNSRIWPFKLMVGRQAIDSVNNTLAAAHVWGPTTDTAFWTNFEWGPAIEVGMKASGYDYSGEYGFVDTEMYWPITHMVAPAADAVACAECHSEDGRMVGLAGIYLPGSNPGSLVALLGKLMVLAALAGVLGHGLLRLVAGRKGGSHG